MNLDVVTVMIMTGAVVTTVGVIFITDMLRRHSEGAGRLWALSFLAGMLTIVCYAAWGASPDAWWAVAIGNAAFVAIPGIVWLGARRYNGRGLVMPSIVAGAAAAATGLSVVFAVDRLDPWAGAVEMFLLAAVLAFCAAASARRAPLRHSPAASALSGVMIVAAVYYLARLVTFVVLGPGSPAFEIPFGTVAASMVTCILTVITASVLTTILAEQRTLAAVRKADALVLATDGVFDGRSFAVLLADAVRRVGVRRESAAVISVRMDDLDGIATAFGSMEADELRRIWRQSTRDTSPTEAVVGEDPSGGLLVLLAPASAIRARAVAVQIRRGVHDAVMAARMSVVPTVRVGVAVVTEEDLADATADHDLIGRARSDADADRNA